MRSLLAPARADHIRASDADRERTVEFLRRHCGEGRLAPQELEERVGDAYAARTLGDLAWLTADLPADTGQPARRPGALRRAGAIAVAAVAGLLAVILVLPALPPIVAWIVGGLVIAMLAFAFTLAVSVAPIVAIAAGAVWIVRRLWPGGGRPLGPLP